uniref:Family with sequence similarity 113 n=1 Tax=Oryzias latipes TaxID=8090 RepID=A0A3P9JEV4_ORYLA
MKTVRHQQACQLLHNKFVVVLGDSIQRGVYKDLVLILQSDRYLTQRQLKSKGEMSFEQDCLVEGGCLNHMNNGTEYREVRQFQSDHHLVRFYFVTRVFSQYMESIMEDFQQGLKPDVVIINSCVWDISRYNSNWLEDYQENLHRFFGELSCVLPEETLVIWNLTMPLGKSIRGGFLVSEIEHKAPQLRYDVIEANFYSGTLADAYQRDVLDLHFHFRFSLQHRTNDGVHWNAVAHRSITCLLLEHIAQAWGVLLPDPLRTVGEERSFPTKRQRGAFIYFRISTKTKRYKKTNQDVDSVEVAVSVRRVTGDEVEPEGSRWRGAGGPAGAAAETGPGGGRAPVHGRMGSPRGPQTPFLPASPWPKTRQTRQKTAFRKPEQAEVTRLYLDEGGHGEGGKV